MSRSVWTVQWREEGSELGEHHGPFRKRGENGPESFGPVPFGSSQHGGGQKGARAREGDILERSLLVQSGSKVLRLDHLRRVLEEAPKVIVVPSA